MAIAGAQSAGVGAVQYATCVRARDQSAVLRVMGAVVEPNFRWWWIGRVRNRGPAGAAGKLAAGVGRDRGRCDGQCVRALLVWASGRVSVRACAFIEQARRNVEALVGRILGEAGSILGWAQWDCQECVDCSGAEKSFFRRGASCWRGAGRQRGLAGYNLTVWIRETQLNLLGGLEGAGAARCRSCRCGRRCKELASQGKVRPEESDSAQRGMVPMGI